MKVQRVPVLPQHRFDEAALARWLEAHVPEAHGPLTVQQFQGGQSNPTFHLDVGGLHLVMRKRPPGMLLPSAHQVDREYRVISALQGSGVPVPRTYGLCTDPAVIGTDFYVMEYIEGRVTQDRSLPELSPPDRRAVYADLARVMAALHAVDPVAVGLGDFGRAGGYVARQIKRWSGQYEASKTRELPVMDRLIAWVSANIPEEDETTVIHGDYRIGNVLLHPIEPRIVAVLDWELSTLGHPVAADLAYCCMAWHQPADVARPTNQGFAGRDLAALGIPSEDEFLADYQRHSGRSTIPNWRYYLAFSFFRSAAIAEGVYARGLAGNASDPTALTLAWACEATARLGVAQIEALERDAAA